MHYNRHRAGFATCEPFVFALFSFAVDICASLLWAWTADEFRWYQTLPAILLGVPFTFFWCLVLPAAIISGLLHKNYPPNQPDKPPQRPNHKAINFADTSVLQPRTDNDKPRDY